jgi:hypothetical protein
MDAFIRQGGKARVDFGSHVVAGVVLGEEIGSLVPLLERIEGATRQAAEIDVGAGDRPVNLLHRNVIGRPCFHPAVKTGHHGFVGIVGVAWSKRLEAVKRVEVSQRPRN